MTETHPDESLYVELEWDGRDIELEYRWVGARGGAGPIVVFLHEGLGAVSMWRDFPEHLCRAHGLRGLVFSRYGYGKSTPRPVAERLGPDYLQRQAWEALPAFLKALGIERPWLFGHSDGGSIALLFAARFPDAVRGIAVIAPHIFVEEITLAGIRAARQAYEAGPLRARLARHHRDVDSAFYGWNDAWLDPAFRMNIEDELERITCPILALQGEDDEYGTLEQIRGIARRNPRCEVRALAGCGHAPHRDAPELLAELVGAFVKQG